MFAFNELMSVIARRAEVADAAARARADGDAGHAERLDYLLARWDGLIALMVVNATRH